MAAILITGFGRFPGAPFNPTIGLVGRLERSRRPALADVRVVTHVFATRYAAVDRELPAPIARENPDAILLFGVAMRAERVRIERIARNRVSLLFPDAGGAKPRLATIALNAPRWRAGRFCLQRLLAAVRSTGVPVEASRNAGFYLCNYAYWRALDAAARAGGPRLVVFVHGSASVHKSIAASGRAVPALAHPPHASERGRLGRCPRLDARRRCFWLVRELEGSRRSDKNTTLERRAADPRDYRGRCKKSGKF